MPTIPASTFPIHPRSTHLAVVSSPRVATPFGLTPDFAPRARYLRFVFAAATLVSVAAPVAPDACACACGCAWPCVLLSAPADAAAADGAGVDPGGGGGASLIMCIPELMIGDGANDEKSRSLVRQCHVRDVRLQLAMDDDDDDGLLCCCWLERTLGSYVIVHSFVLAAPPGLAGL